jgi:hypothetical protein
MLNKLRSLFLVAMFASVGSLSCSACSSKTTDSLPPVVPSAVVPPVPLPVLLTMKVARDMWEFTLPTTDWVELPKGANTNLVLVNKEKHNLIVMVNEPFPGPGTDYAMLAIQGIRSAGATISSIKQMEINGHNFVLIESGKDNISLYTWVTTAAGQGYGFSCGGASVDGEQSEICSGIMKTFKIK